MSTTIYQQMTEAVQRVADVRAHLTRVRTTYDEAKARFDAEYAGELEAVNAAKAYVADAEATAKALAAAHFLVTGEKRPVPGLEVKARTVLTYDPADALAWAKDTKIALVPETYDAKMLEKVAKATPLPFVTVTTEPMVTLASDLSGVLEFAADRPRINNLTEIQEEVG